MAALRWRALAPLLLVPGLVLANDPNGFTRIPGTRVSVQLPAGFHVAKEFPGIINESAAATVIFNELPKPYRELESATSENSLAKQGIRLVRSEKIELMGQSVTLAHTEQRISGTDVRKWMPAKGRFINQLDVDESLKVCVIGHKIYEKLFVNEEAVGKELRHNRLRYIIVGVMDEMGSGITAGLDYTILVPYTTVFNYNRTDRRLDSITCQAATFKDSGTAIEEIKAALALVHGSADYFDVESPAEVMAGVEKVTLIIKLLLGGIASIALMVGGIGIMNIMLVSVTERTREIGIRKAVGARRRDILGQFLIEAVTLSVSGGIIGIVCGVCMAWVICQALTIGWDAIDKWPFVISLQAVVVSTAFAIVVGIIFGVYPAMKAARLDPVEALRYE